MQGNIGLVLHQTWFRSQPT